MLDVHKIREKNALSRGLQGRNRLRNLLDVTRLFQKVSKIFIDFSFFIDENHEFDKCSLNFR